MSLRKPQQPLASFDAPVFGAANLMEVWLYGLFEVGFNDGGATVKPLAMPQGASGTRAPAA